MMSLKSRYAAWLWALSLSPEVSSLSPEVSSLSPEVLSFWCTWWLCLLLLHWSGWSLSLWPCGLRSPMASAWSSSPSPRSWVAEWLWSSQSWPSTLRWWCSSRWRSWTSWWRWLSASWWVAASSWSAPGLMLWVGTALGSRRGCRCATPPGPPRRSTAGPASRAGSGRGSPGASPPERRRGRARPRPQCGRARCAGGPRSSATSPRWR
mmetsp:Transcript_92417/g.261356  ORF Transcript_92417/g.261356 Transcript_92417/m.261356 type:complete len:208 (-) Transcript_92417:801-1424(-)